MTSRWLSPVLLSFVFVAGACGKKKDDAAGGGGKPAATKVVASCDQRATPGPVKTCLEYVGSNWTAKEVEARCAGDGKIFLPGACPTEGVVFSCTQEAGKPMEGINRYYDNVDKAKQICAAIGVPTP